ncbi:histidine kinase N-terminal 7TM domain-containing diguanylate cyclase [Aquipuribacter sp. SD81]|uniref:histidine kinase N-terminal 7TM domain-containing diguanylate cyclase n=1 Tax=Aquipuribacter sp. SD81 TaxID=3127703 RepID=UPI003019128C
MLDVLDLACLATALVAGATGAFLLLGRRSAMSSRSLAVVMLSAATWALLSIALSHVPGVAAAAAVTRVIVAAAAVQATAGAWFCLSLAGRRPSGRSVRLLSVHPVLLSLALLTDAWTGLVVEEVRTEPTGLVVVFGLGFWAHTLYCYALLGWGLVALLVAAGRAVSGHRLHYLLAVGAVLPPVCGNAVSVLGAGGGQRDLTAPLFVVTAMLWFWVDRWSPRFRSAPITTPQVLQALSDGVVVVDALGRIVDVNPAALRMLAGVGSRRSHVVGRHWRDVVDEDLVVAVEAEGTRSVLRPDGSVVDVRVTPVVAGGARTGWVVVARDVTEVERLRGELAEQALRDGLTGLHNRRHLEQVLAAAVAEHAVLSLAVVDVDHFKAVNDAHGHLVGDEVLVALSRLLQAAAGADGVAARLGGEEFVLVLPGLTAGRAHDRVEDLRRRCGGVVVPARDGTVRVSVSAGIAQLRPGQDAARLLAAADAALYAAKAAGRDRVVLADPVPAPR